MSERTADDGQADSITSTLHALKRAARQDRVSLGTLIDQLGQRTYGPLFFTIGLIALSPIGAIPGASVVCATLIVLLAVQMSFGSHTPWVPGALRRLEVDGDLGRRSIERVEPYLRWLDRLTQARWSVLLSRPALHAVVLGLCALAVLMYPLALVPWGVLPVAAAITVIGLGLLTADGLITAIGLAVALVGGGGGLYILSG
ncbi:exopolysaccharide biosynthesis protein [Rhodovibrio salinarum]|uniref:Exopolysaccharide synthesis, ExoD n=1 Tax=Rhodovibrio salinarum TaxID=1087 RepID=A0A934QFZ7_9PROT|nr:exopolysaccharide biosynthesis protein [Rhodovibrio salinarum]MBK1695942.1 hypothetical protein [Rhodovibrio salinarum]